MTKAKRLALIESIKMGLELRLNLRKLVQELSPDMRLYLLRELAKSIAGGGHEA